MKKVLILGYGNADRQDDGVAWHVLAQLARRMGAPVPESPDEGLDIQVGNIDLLFALQLYPEMAERFVRYDHICFVDAHTGSVPENLHVEELQPQYQKSPLTHHMTPNTVLELARALFQATPQAHLVSIRGFEFGFSRELSPEANQLVDEAAEVIFTWSQQERAGCEIL